MPKKITEPRKVGHPKSPGILIRVPVRFANEEDYALIVGKLSVNERATILIEAAKKKE